MSKVCQLCRTVGGNGAQWIAHVDGEKLRVHKPCGLALKKSAPEGTTVEIVPSFELKEQFKKEAQERRVRSFWAQKFQKARPLRDSKGSHILEVA